MYVPNFYKSIDLFTRELYLRSCGNQGVIRILEPVTNNIVAKKEVTYAIDVHQGG